jgi:hypothetical protein
VPVSVNVSVCVALVWPTVVAGKDRLVAEREIAEMGLEPDVPVDPLLQPTTVEAAKTRHPERSVLLTMGLFKLR